jgi:hypothetical protein
LCTFGDHAASPVREELCATYLEFGQWCYEESVPLHEAVRMIHILKHKLIESTRDQMILQTPVDLYAQEEFEHHIGRLFEASIRANIDETVLPVIFTVQGEKRNQS